MRPQQERTQLRTQEHDESHRNAQESRCIFGETSKPQQQCRQIEHFDVSIIIFGKAGKIVGKTICCCETQK
jgi:hypothetical protein